MKDKKDFLNDDAKEIDHSIIAEENEEFLAEVPRESSSIKPVEKKGVPRNAVNEAARRKGGTFSPANLPGKKFVKNQVRNMASKGIAMPSKKSLGTNPSIKNDDLENKASAEPKVQDAKSKSPLSNGLKSANKEALKDVVGDAIKAGAKKLAIIIFTNPITYVVLFFIMIFLVILIVISDDNGTKKDIYGYCNSNCDGMSIKQTSLSKSEFVSKVREYFSNGTSKSATVFYENAEIIYDIAQDIGINPEMVVIRAILEGFSPGFNKNNYWGMGCFNGSNSCISYSSFEDGVRGYAENISQYESVTAMAYSYAYIGRYWYNPGSSSLGGCYYFPSIKEYMTESRAATVERICNGSGCTTSGVGCTETTEEDQKAYATWQVNNMLGMRTNVFGLEPDICNNKCYTGDYSIDPNDEMYAGLQLLHGTSFEEILAANNMTTESYNQFLVESIEKAGVGTRDGVIAAATSLIGSIAEMGYKLNYEWGGKFPNIGVNPKWGNRLPAASVNNICSSHAIKYGGNTCVNNYAWSGFDCSGFVTWAVINGMQDSAITQNTVSASPFIPLDKERAVCKPGGTLNKPGHHIVLVIGIDDEKKQYIVAESTGSRINENSGGVKISRYSYGANGYSCQNLDDIYND